MSRIKQKFVGGEHPGVYVDDLHSIQFEIRAFAANKCVNTKGVCPQRCCNRAAKFQKSRAVDVASYVLMMEEFRNLAESTAPSRLLCDGVLDGDAEKIRRSSRVACKGHANFQSIRYELLGNVGSVFFPKKTSQRVLIPDAHNTE